MYKQYSLVNVSLENVYLILRRKDICLDADLILVSMLLLHLLFECKITPKCLYVFKMFKTVLSIFSSIISSIYVFKISITSFFLEGVGWGLEIKSY